MAPRDPFEMSSRVHPDRDRFAIEVFELPEPVLGSAQYDRAGFRDRNRKSADGAAFRTDRHTRHRDVEAVHLERRDQLRPAEAHELDFEIAVSRVGPCDLDIEANEINRGVARGRAERRVVAARSHAKRVRARHSRGDDERRGERQQRRRRSPAHVSTSRSLGAAAFGSPG